MARLIYSTIMSLDGYIADADGNFEWAGPDEEVHAFVNDLVRPVGTYLYGRRMYETSPWRPPWPSTPGPGPVDSRRAHAPWRPVLRAALAVSSYREGDSAG